MDTIFGLSLLVLLTFSFLGILKPANIGLKSRKKAMLFTLLPFIILLTIWMVIRDKKNEAAKNDPENATEVSYYLEHLTQIPSELADFKKLKILDLDENEISELDSSVLMQITTLEELDLSNNPIKSIPLWIIKMKKLKTLILDNTQISEIPEIVNSKIVNISYENTPLSQKLMPGEIEIDAQKSSESDTSAESLSEFGWRYLSGNEHGYSLEFDNSEIFYIQPVTENQAQKLGDFLTKMKFFSDETEASVQLTSKNNIYHVKFVVDEEKLNEDVINAFKLYRIMIESEIFDNKPTNLHLCNNKLQTIKELKK